MLLEDAAAFPAVWGQDYGREGNSSRNRASPCSIINRCITEKERDGHEPSDSFVSLSKSPSSQASEGRHGRFDAEASCQGNGNISRCKSSGCQRNPNEKEGQQGAPGAAWGGGILKTPRDSNLARLSAGSFSSLLFCTHGRQAVLPGPCWKSRHLTVGLNALVNLSHPGMKVFWKV